MSDGPERRPCGDDAKRAAANIRSEAEDRAEAIIRSAKSSCNTILADFNTKIEEGRAALKTELDRLKADMADERVTHSLQLEGCLNAKAAKALLGDYDGDVAKLKDQCPYLFAERKTGSTGLKTQGDASDLDDKLDKAFKLK